MQDLRLAVRSLRATPVATFVAVLSLALGIGGNTAVFSILNSLLFKSLPVREPSQLVAVDAVGPTEYVSRRRVVPTVAHGPRLPRSRFRSQSGPRRGGRSAEKRRACNWSC